MHICPKCESEDIHRSHTRSTWEAWRKAITARRPYRCLACDWRGWGPDFGARFGEHGTRLLAEPAVPAVSDGSGPPTPAKAPLSAADLSRLDLSDQGTDWDT